IQCTAEAPWDSISGKVSSLIAATTTSAPRARAASSTRRGKRPLPAIRPIFSIQWPLFNNPALRALDKTNQHANVFVGVFFCLEFLQCLRGIELRGEQEFESVVDLANTFAAETAAFQSDGVYPVGMGVARGDRFGKRKYVFRDNGPTTYISMRANRSELMYGRKSSNRGPLRNVDMPGERGSVCHDYVIANKAVMRHMGIRHDQDVIANARYPSTRGRAPMQGYELANHIVIPDLEPSPFAGILQVLWRQSDGGKRKNPIVVPKSGGAFKHDVRHQLAVFAHLYVRSNDAVGANPARGGDSCLGINNGSGMNLRANR